jgi:hypothetical protein
MQNTINIVGALNWSFVTRSDDSICLWAQNIIGGFAIYEASPAWLAAADDTEMTTGPSQGETFSRKRFELYEVDREGEHYLHASDTLMNLFRLAEKVKVEIDMDNAD